MMNMITPPRIIDIALDQFDRFNATLDESFPIREIITNIESTTMNASLFADITTIHLTLNDELHDLILIAIYDCDSLELESLILHSDATSQIIPLNNDCD
jgi:hypothetical protein